MSTRYLGEMDKFLESYKQLKLILKEIENPNRYITRDLINNYS
jgi:hypothetical protein